MSKFLLTLAVAAMCCCLAASNASATLIAYEGFDTAAANGTQAETAGVTGSGFSPYGSGSVGYWRMKIWDGLSYTDSLGNTLDVVGKSAGMDAPVSGTANLQLGLNDTLVNSGTAYMSFLLDVTDVTTWSIQVGLQDAQVGTISSCTATLEAAFRSTSTNYGIYGDQTGIDARGGPAVAPGSFLFISELDMDNEVMTAWLNPANLADVAGTATHTMVDTADLGWSDMTSFILSLGGEEAGTVDEIRIGTTLADVVPYTAVPEPNALVLVSLGFCCLVGRRNA